MKRVHRAVLVLAVSGVSAALAWLIDVSTMGRFPDDPNLALEVVSFSLTVYLAFSLLWSLTGLAILCLVGALRRRAVSTVDLGVWCVTLNVCLFSIVLGGYGLNITLLGGIPADAPLSLGADLAVILLCGAGSLLIGHLLRRLARAASERWGAPVKWAFLVGAWLCCLAAAPWPVVALTASGGPERAAPDSGVSRQAPGGGPNILLVVVDALRNDHLSCNGYPRATTPFLDRLAEGGVKADRFLVASSWTKPSVATLFSGLMPFSHKVNTYSARMPDPIETLAEILWRHGYHTASFSANPFSSDLFGFDRGFDIAAFPGQSRLVKYNDFTVLGRVVNYFLSRWAGHEDRVVMDRIRGWLDDGPAEPFFAYVHLMSAHAPYDPPPRYREVFDPGYTGRVITNPETTMALSGAELHHMIARYDGGIRYVDDLIREVWTRLEGAGLAGNCILVVTSDHGEAFREHGRFGHGTDLYEEVLHVPLILHAPSLLPRRSTLSAPVSSVDLYPTILDLVGVPPPDGLEGRSFLPSIRTPPAEPGRTIVSELSLEGRRHFALRVGGVKYIYHEGTGGDPDREELYDLSVDPGEKEDLASSTDPRLPAMRERLEHHRSSSKSDIPEAAAEIDDEMKATLEALGYMM